MINPASGTDRPSSPWKNLYRVSGIAALIAGIVFRRNLGVEISLFSAQKQPETVAGWLSLLQTNRLLGLAYLNIFDVVNYLLVSLVFLALYIVLRRSSKSLMSIATMLGFLGIAVFLASNTALSLLPLSDQYANASGEAQKTILLAAGQSLLALNRFGASGAHPGAAGYLSLLLVAISGLMICLTMLRSSVFNRWTAIVGLLASGLDLIYCLAYIFLPAADGSLLAVSFIPAAGLFYLLWHVLIGIRLLRLSRLEENSLLEPAFG